MPLDHGHSQRSHLGSGSGVDVGLDEGVVGPAWLFIAAQ